MHGKEAGVGESYSAKSTQSQRWTYNWHCTRISSKDSHCAEGNEGKKHKQTGRAMHFVPGEGRRRRRVKEKRCNDGGANVS